MTKQNDGNERSQTENNATTEANVRRTTGVVARAVALGLLTAAVGMTTACCNGAGEGEGEGEGE